jgi:hypothetical protein
MTTTSNIEFTYNGKVYQQVSATRLCDGCALHYTVYKDGCNSANAVRPCSDDFIYAEKQPETKTVAVQEPAEPAEPVWTLTQICDAYYKWDNNTSWTELQQELVKLHERELAKQSPEYQQYLLLKAKFEDAE